MINVSHLKPYICGLILSATFAFGLNSFIIFSQKKAQALSIVVLQEKINAQLKPHGFEMVSHEKISSQPDVYGLHFEMIGDKPVPEFSPANIIWTAICSVSLKSGTVFNIYYYKTKSAELHADECKGDVR